MREKDTEMKKQNVLPSHCYLFYIKNW